MPLVRLRLLFELPLGGLSFEDHSQSVDDEGVLVEQTPRLRKNVKLLTYVSNTDQLVGDVAVSSAGGLVEAEAAVSVAPLVDDSLMDGVSEFG